MAVNFEARAKAAQSMEQYLNRDIDNVALDRALVEAGYKDTACYELRRALVDTLYSLWDCHRNEGQHELTLRQQQMFQRWVALLRSTEEWPLPSRFDSSVALRPFVGLYDCLGEFLSCRSPFQNEYWPYKTSDDWGKLKQED